MTDLITCNHITVHNERTLALKDVSFSVKKGEFLTIVGENGAGKSTLVRVILGIHTPEEGTVDIHKTAIGNIGATRLLPFYSRAHKARAKGYM